jgi:hypothetical protein
MLIFVNITPRAKEMEYPSSKTFTDAYKVIEIGSMPNKTRETSFQVLNRTNGPTKKPIAPGLQKTQLATDVRRKSPWNTCSTDARTTLQ